MRTTLSLLLLVSASLTAATSHARVTEPRPPQQVRPASPKRPLLSRWLPRASRTPVTSTPRAETSAPAAPVVDTLSRTARARGVHVSENVDHAAARIFGAEPPTIDTLQELFQAPPGYSFRIRSMVSARSDRIQLHIDLYDGDKPTDATINLQFAVVDGKRIVLFDHFYVKGLKERGLARAFFRSTLPGYRKLGIERIDVEAAEDGRYVWALFGFTWSSSPSTYERAFKEFLKHNVGMSHEDAVKYSKHAERADTLADFVLDDRPLGREFLLKSKPWKGSLPLDPSDPGYQRAIARSS